MQRWMLKSKIHRATVTMADLDYEGSIEIDSDLLEAADIVPFEMVKVWNVTTGDRFETYSMPGEPGSGTICINGAAAHRANVGDLVIIASFVSLDEQDLSKHEPKLIFVDDKNRVKDMDNKKGLHCQAC